MRRAVAAVLLSLLLLFVGVDSSAIGEPSEAVPAAVESVHHVASRTVADLEALVAIVVHAASLWLVGLAALALCCVDVDREDRRVTLRWVAGARRGPPALAR